MIIISRRKNMQHLFSMVPKANINRSRFDRSFGHKTTFDSGYLVPIFIDEVLPGDTIDLKTHIFLRVATLISPIMDRLICEVFYFNIPERLVYEYFQKMCGEQDNPNDSTDYLFPTLTGTNMAVGSLWDYLGLPTGITNALTVRAEPFRCYNLVYNEWFRDENLQDSVTFVKGETDNISNYNLLRRGKRHDYFTSALPWPQKGPGVELPLGGSADIAMKSGASAVSNVLNSNYLNGTGVIYTGYNNRQLFGDNVPAGGADGTKLSLSVPLSTTVLGGIANNLQADLSSATAITINSLRQAFQIQRWYEQAARGGTRYTEILLSFFGVQSPDARLQRPEYLGGMSFDIDVSAVPQTSASDTTTPQANLAAMGYGSASKKGFRKSFVEHGWILGLINVRAPLTYQQGINKMWLRSTKFDMYWPTFAHLGEQVVENREIYAQGTAADTQAFGYQERYAEYRYYPSMITGKFRSTYSQTLDSWHLSQKFDVLPVLNEEFIQDTPPVDRVIAVQDEPQFLADIWFQYTHVRPMPVYGTPGLIDHF